MLQRSRIVAQKQHACSSGGSKSCLNPLMPVVGDDDAIIRRRSSTRIRRFEQRKRVRSEHRKCDDRYHHRSVRFHTKMLSPCSNNFYDASVGFSVATEGRIANPSSEGEAEHVSERLVRAKPVPFLARPQANDRTFPAAIRHPRTHHPRGADDAGKVSAA